MTDDLASGFHHVDRATDFATFSSCLTLIDSLPFFADGKRESYVQLGAAPGRDILDVGCGLGDDAAALAKLVAPDGSVVGVDGSHAMVEAARTRHRGITNLLFSVADAADLPFSADSFHGCRVDRVLQHVADPAEVVAEMVRVVRPGGTVLAFDNDWETLTVNSADRTTTRAVMNAWCDRFPSGWVGRRLVPLFRQAGLRDVVAHPRTLLLYDLDVADRIFSLFTTLDGLVDTGLIDGRTAELWRAELTAADADGTFFSSYTGFLVTGIPAGSPCGSVGSSIQ